MKVNSIKLFNTRRQISFKEGSNNNMTSDVAALALQNPNAMIEFKNNLKTTQLSDAVQTSPLKALAYKFVKTFKLLFSPQVSKEVEAMENLSREMGYVLA